MRASPLSLCLGASLLLTGQFACAQVAATDPVGFLGDAIPANSDAAATVPLTRTPAWRGGVAAISGNTITVTGNPNWQTSPTKQFQRIPGTQPNTYYVQIGDGAKAGLYATITDNGTNTLTVQLNPTDDLTGIATDATAGAGNGAKVSIFPYWTPATLFPADWPTGTQVLLFDDALAGVNHAASLTLIYSGTQWFNNGTNEDASELLIHPLDSFVIRNVTATALERTVLGSVPMIRHRSIISTLAANQAQDIHIAYTSPAPELIGNSSLGFSPGDQLLVFDNATPGQNKSASQVLIYSGTEWFDNATAQNVSATFSLQPGRGYIFRKAATPAPQDFVWQDTQTYNQ